MARSRTHRDERPPDRRGEPCTSEDVAAASAPGATDDGYFTDHDHQRLERWRRISAQRPAFDVHQVGEAGALLRAMRLRRLLRSESDDSR
jgi:hypothetical protein